jgi:large subunit ribosomal protein L25
MLQVEMTASIRKETGKGAMRQLRMKGMTPAVVYGDGPEGLALQLETRPFFQQLLTIYRTNAVITLKLDDGSIKYVLMQDVQTDPVKDTLIHADFLEIDVAKSRSFQVPVQYTGTARGCDLGGVLNIIERYLTIEGTPLDIPDEFIVDVTAMEIGDRITVDTIEIPDNVKYLGDAEQVCVTVAMASAQESEDEDEGEEEDDVEAEAGTDAEAAAETKE